MEAGDLGVGIVEVADPDGPGRTDDHARRLEPLFDPVVAEVALVGRGGGRVDVDGVVRAGVDARLAADAVVVVEVDHAVVGTEQCRRRADGHAGCVLALVAPHDREVPVGVGEDAGLDVLDPGAVDADRYVVFALARHGAGVAADAVARIEHEAEPGHWSRRPSRTLVTRKPGYRVTLGWMPLQSRSSMWSNVSSVSWGWGKPSPASRWAKPWNAARMVRAAWTSSSSVRS